MLLLLLTYLLKLILLSNKKKTIQNSPPKSATNCAHAFTLFRPVRFLLPIWCEPLIRRCHAAKLAQHRNATDQKNPKKAPTGAGKIKRIGCRKKEKKTKTKNTPHTGRVFFGPALALTERAPRVTHPLCASSPVARAFPPQVVK